MDWSTFTNVQLLAVVPGSLSSDDLQTYDEELNRRGLSSAPPPTLPSAPPPGGEPGVHEFTFASAAATWTVVHGLSRKPLVETLTALGEEFDADVEYPDLATVVITHAVPTAGSVLIA